MAIHTSKPLFDDGVVVFVARSYEDARRARDALLAAGVRMEDMPDEALRTMFEEGQRTVSVRVHAGEFARAMDVIDAVFPGRAQVEDAPPAAEDVAPRRPEEAREPVDAALDDHERQVLRRSTLRRKLEESAGRVAVIAGASLFLPGLGVATGLFAVVSALWCLPKAAELDAPRARGQALLGLGLGLAACLAQVLFLWLAWRGDLVAPR